MNQIPLEFIVYLNIAFLVVLTFVLSNLKNRYRTLFDGQSLIASDLSKLQESVQQTRTTQGRLKQSIGELEEKVQELSQLSTLIKAYPKTCQDALDRLERQTQRSASDIEEIALQVELLQKKLATSQEQKPSVETVEEYLRSKIIDPKQQKIYAEYIERLQNGVNREINVVMEKLKKATERITSL